MSQQRPAGLTTRDTHLVLVDELVNELVGRPSGLDAQQPRKIAEVDLGHVAGGGRVVVTQRQDSPELTALDCGARP